MPGTPMKRRVLAALQARATRECGEGATIVDFACGFFAAGHDMSALAELLASDLGHNVSRSFVSYTLNNLEPDAKQRLESARRSAQADFETKLTELRTELEALKRNPVSASIGCVNPRPTSLPPSSRVPVSSADSRPVTDVARLGAPRAN